MVPRVGVGSMFTGMNDVSLNLNLIHFPLFAEDFGVCS